MPQTPSHFYKCPHCGHILLKDKTMMSLAGTGAGFGIIGGGCPDCRQPLDAESVYVAGKYDITVAEIAKGNYGPMVVNNILAAHRAGKVTLTPEELKLLNLAPAPQVIFRRKDLRYIIPIVLVVVAVVFTCVFSSQPKQDQFGVPPILKTTILEQAAPGSKIVSAQSVTKNNLELWCIVTESKTGQEHWIVSGSVTGNSAATNIMEAVLPSNFANVGCTNWGGASAAIPATASVPTATGVPATENIPTATSAPARPTLMLSAYGISLPYDPAVWDVDFNRTTLYNLEIAKCQVWGKEPGLYPAPPDRPADREVNDGNLAYKEYKLQIDETTTSTTYIIQSGIPGYDPASHENMPIILYAMSTTATWDACNAAVEKLLTDISTTSR